MKDSKDVQLLLFTTAEIRSQAAGKDSIPLFLDRKAFIVKSHSNMDVQTREQGQVVNGILTLELAVQ